MAPAILSPAQEALLVRALARPITLSGREPQSLRPLVRLGLVEVLRHDLRVRRGELGGVYRWAEITVRLTAEGTTTAKELAR